ncbi:MAG TPA: hypothetical protein DD635_00515 [Flavobacteriales bacterium]|nr:hypothetical protein [Flavobacteriales bacterium]
MFRIKSHLCKECGDRLNGRSDKLFCDDTCRVRHHRKSNSQHALRRDVDHVLQRNRLLLASLRKSPYADYNAEDRAFWLRRQGFDFNFHTHVLPLKDGRMAIMCYDEGYVLDGDGILPWKDISRGTESLAPSMLS